jgi:hypothetical protein
MRRADFPDRPVTLFDVVKRAVDIVDPDDEDRTWAAWRRSSRTPTSP